MPTDVEEDMGPFDDMEETEAIHLWFSLTYSNYLVLQRSLLQSMSPEWQRRFVRCLNELEEAFNHVPRARSFLVQARDQDGRFVHDPVPHYNRGRTHVDRWDELTAEDRAALQEAHVWGVTRTTDA